MKQVKAIFVYERDTKNTIRFQEQVAGELDVPMIGNIYVSKSTLKALGWTKDKPLALTVECK